MCLWEDNKESLMVHADTCCQSYYLKMFYAMKITRLFYQLLKCIFHNSNDSYSNLFVIYSLVFLWSIYSLVHNRKVLEILTCQTSLISLNIWSSCFFNFPCKTLFYCLLTFCRSTTSNNTTWPVFEMLGYHLQKK
jgi:hypothetical protein